LNEKLKFLDDERTSPDETGNQQNSSGRHSSCAKVIFDDSAYFEVIFQLTTTNKSI